MPDESIDCCVTSPPYWGLRDYGVAGQLGLERTPEEYVAKMVEVFREVKRVLKAEGTLWLNLGDSYAAAVKGGSQGKNGQRANRRFTCGVIPKISKGLKPKDLCGIPWRVAFALQADGWYLRQDIIWHKPNPMPESVTDRCTKAHEYIFLMSKRSNYYFNQDAIREICKTEGEDVLGVGKSWNDHKEDLKKGNRIKKKTNHPLGANKRSVWTVSTKPFTQAHFATFPPDLIEPCIKAGCPPNGTMLDPFMGSGTVGMASKQLGRKFIGIELNLKYVEMAKRRIANTENALFV
jgi:DNA modification methylase